MQCDANWVRTTLAEIQRKKDMQKTLRDKLAAWDGDCDLGAVPVEKRVLLENLTSESLATIQAMIDRIESDIQALFARLREANG